MEEYKNFRALKLADEEDGQMRSQLSVVSGRERDLWQGMVLKLAWQAGRAHVGLFKCAGPAVLLGALAASLTSPDISPLET